MAEAAEGEVEQGLGRTVKDLVSGAAGGIAQVLIGMYCLYNDLSGAVCSQCLRLSFEMILSFQMLHTPFHSAAFEVILVVGALRENIPCLKTYAECNCQICCVSLCLIRLYPGTFAFYDIVYWALTNV